MAFAQVFWCIILQNSGSLAFINAPHCVKVLHPQADIIAELSSALYQNAPLLAERQLAVWTKEQLKDLKYLEGN